MRKLQCYFMFCLPHWTFIFVLVMMKCQKISLIFFPAFQQYVESLLFLWLPRSILVFSDMYFFEFFHKIFVLFNLLPALFRKKLKNIWQLDRQLYKSVTVFLFLCHNHKIYSKFTWRQYLQFLILFPISKYFSFILGILHFKDF